jgi:hypothetical protein
MPPRSVKRRRNVPIRRAETRPIRSQCGGAKVAPAGNRSFSQKQASGDPKFFRDTTNGFAGRAATI